MPEQPTRVLIVAHKTAATPALLEVVRERAAAGPCRFTLVVPNPAAHGLHRVVDPEDVGASEGEQVLALALPLLSDAAGSRVDGIIGDPAPLTAAEDAVNQLGFDEIIVSTLPARVSRWLHLDLPRKLTGLGLPVRTVTPQDREPVSAA